MEQVVARGTNVMDVASLGQYDSQFAEGDYQRLKINFVVAPVADMAGQVVGALAAAGVVEHYAVWTEGSSLVIQAQVWQPFPWAILIAAAGGFLLGLLVVSWVYSRISEAFGALVPVILIGGVCVAAWIIFSG